jgi:hypothetical protein
MERTRAQIMARRSSRNNLRQGDVSDYRQRTKTGTQSKLRDKIFKIFKKQLIICIIIILVMSAIANMQTDWSKKIENMVSNNLRYHVDYNKIIEKIGAIYFTFVEGESNEN